MHAAYTQKHTYSHTVCIHTHGCNIDKMAHIHTCIHTKILYSVLIIFILCSGRLLDALLFRLQYWFLSVTKLWGVALSAPCVLHSAPNRYTCFKSTRLLLCCASVWLNPAVWEQGTLPDHTCPLNPWTARLAPITVPQCIISKWTDLYIKIQTTTYSGQVPLKASALRWIKSSDRMMDNPHMRAGPDSVR